MIEGVTQHQAALPDQSRNDNRVCCKAHAEGDGIFTSHKMCYQTVKLNMLICLACNTKSQNTLTCNPGLVACEQ